MLSEINMKKRDIYITDFDMERLKEVIKTAKEKYEKDKDCLAKLDAELGRAQVLPRDAIPPDVVTMNSVISLKDLDTQEEMVFRLVYPGETDFGEEVISVLAPVGTAVLGYKVGDTIEWEVPDGIRRLLITEILHQPEAEGELFL
jgi:regulator of nucleoside diphosphate kinase